MDLLRLFTTDVDLSRVAPGEIGEQLTRRLLRERRWSVRAVATMLGGLAEQPQGHVMELQDEARLRAMLCAVVDWVVLLPSALTRTNQPLRGIGATWFGLQEDPEGDAVLINGGGEEDSRKRDKEQEDDDKRDIEQRRKRYEAYEQWIHGTLRPTLDRGDGQLLSTTILRLWSESSYLSPHLDRLVPEILAHQVRSAQLDLVSWVNSLRDPFMGVEPLLMLLMQPDLQRNAGITLSALIPRPNGLLGVLRGLLDNVGVPAEAAVNVVVAVPSTMSPVDYFTAIAPQVVQLLLVPNHDKLHLTAALLFERAVRSRSPFAACLSAALEQQQQQQATAALQTLLVRHSASPTLIKHVLGSCAALLGTSIDDSNRAIIEACTRSCGAAVVQPYFPSIALPAEWDTKTTAITTSSASKDPVDAFMLASTPEQRLSALFDLSRSPVASTMSDADWERNYLGPLFRYDSSQDKDTAVTTKLAQVIAATAARSPSRLRTLVDRVVREQSPQAAEVLRQASAIEPDLLLPVIAAEAQPLPAVLAVVAACLSAASPTSIAPLLPRLLAQVGLKEEDPQADIAAIALLKALRDHNTDPVLAASVLAQRDGIVQLERRLSRLL